MRVSIDPGDRKLLIISGGLLIAIGLVGFLLAPATAGTAAGFPSSYATDAGGGKAAYLLLGEFGYRVERWNSSPDQLPVNPVGTVLVLASPSSQPSASETSRVRAFVRAGGRLVAAGTSSLAFLPEHREVATKKPVYEFQKFAAEVPSPVTLGAPEILMRTNFRWARPAAGQQRLYGDADGPVVIEQRLGKGQVIWWADSSPLTNYGLAQSSNLMLLLNSVGPSAVDANHTRVLWDEYYHGERASLWSYLGRTPAPWALVQLAVMVLAAILTFARRNGPVRPLTRESRLSPLEFIDTLGALYQRKGAAREALEIAYHRFRLTLAGRLGLPPSSSADEIAHGVRDRLGWTVPGFWETLQRAERGLRSGTLPEGRALLLVQELHDYARRFRLEAAGRGE
ncbi:MAG TPA: DUF4350 domain-containing protein [Terriglobia bacterium]|nr:DUF4350 domain-containing protein [Terriglobia bacterium]